MVGSMRDHRQECGSRRHGDPLLREDEPAELYIPMGLLGPLVARPAQKYVGGDIRRSAKRLNHWHRVAPAKTVNPARLRRIDTIIANLAQSGLRDIFGFRGTTRSVVQIETGILAAVGLGYNGGTTFDKGTDLVSYRSRRCRSGCLPGSRKHHSRRATATGVVGVAFRLHVPSTVA